MLSPQLVACWKEETSYGFGVDCGARARVHWLRVEQWICGDVQRRDPGVYYVRLSSMKLGLFSRKTIRAFASGLGPVPFIMLPEVSPPYVSPMFGSLLCHCYRRDL